MVLNFWGCHFTRTCFKLYVYRIFIPLTRNNKWFWQVRFNSDDIESLKFELQYQEVNKSRDNWVVPTLISEVRFFYKKLKRTCLHSTRNAHFYLFYEPFHFLNKFHVPFIKFNPNDVYMLTDTMQKEFLAYILPFSQEK